MSSQREKNRIPFISVVWTIYLIALFTATHIPIPSPVSHVVSTYDKIIHGTAYFVLTVLSAATFLHQKSRLSAWVFLAACLLVFAGLDEYLQGFVNRSPDVEDWLSDAVGIAAGCLFAYWQRHRLCRSGPRSVKVERPVGEDDDPISRSANHSSPSGTLTR